MKGFDRFFDCVQVVRVLDDLHIPALGREAAKRASTSCVSARSVLPSSCCRRKPSTGSRGPGDLPVKRLRNRSLTSRRRRSKACRRYSQTGHVHADTVGDSLPLWPSCGLDSGCIFVLRMARARASHSAKVADVLQTGRRRIQWLALLIKRFRASLMEARIKATSRRVRWTGQIDREPATGHGRGRIAWHPARS